MMALLFDHLWQSTLFAGGAGLLTLALSRNSANARFWLWFAASAKLLVPFAVLTALGAYVLAPITPPLPAPALMAMAPVARPFSGPKPVLALTNPAIAPTAPTAPITTHLDLSTLLLALWALGFLAISARWISRWWQLRLLLRHAVPSALVAPIAVKFSTSSLEPGLVGIFRPVILLPAGIEQLLSPAELNAVVAHELGHWRRRDNLLAAFHMLVEALFWFFPLVWWLGARLNAERERACDESVLAAGNDPKTYAEGILKVCRLYLQSPLACAAGVSGGGLKKRMDFIIENAVIPRLNRFKKLLLAASATVALAIPLALGLPIALPALAKVIPQAESSPAAITQAPAPQTDASVEGSDRDAVRHTQNQGATDAEVAPGRPAVSEDNQLGPQLAAALELQLTTELQQLGSLWPVKPTAVRPVSPGEIKVAAAAPLAGPATGSAPRPETEAAVKCLNGLGPDGCETLFENSLKTRRAIQYCAAEYVRDRLDNCVGGPLEALEYLGANANGDDVFSEKKLDETDTIVISAPGPDGKIPPYCTSGRPPESTFQPVCSDGHRVGASIVKVITRPDHALILYTRPQDHAALQPTSPDGAFIPASAPASTDSATQNAPNPKTELALKCMVGLGPQGCWTVFEAPAAHLYFFCTDQYVWGVLLGCPNGPLETVEYLGTNAAGDDLYSVKWMSLNSTYVIPPPGPDGKILNGPARRMASDLQVTSPADQVLYTRPKYDSPLG